MKAKESEPGQWTARILVSVLFIGLGYFASFGPVHALFSRGGSWKGSGQATAKWLPKIYRPAIWLTTRSELYFNFFEWCNSHHPKFNRPGFQALRERDFPR
ncbi:MAG: hypothetical protein HKN23_20755 [Verrucomicrobiales bacterium]|nr:hypothetical protein [Verrucomicrobiales bacterium]